MWSRSFSYKFFGYNFTFQSRICLPFLFYILHKIYFVFISYTAPNNLSILKQQKFVKVQVFLSAHLPVNGALLATNGTKWSDPTSRVNWDLVRWLKNLNSTTPTVAVTVSWYTVDDFLDVSKINSKCRVFLNKRLKIVW